MRILDYIKLKLFLLWANSKLDVWNKKLGEINRERGKTIEEAKEILNT